MFVLQRPQRGSVDVAAASSRRGVSQRRRLLWRLEAATPASGLGLAIVGEVNGPPVAASRRVILVAEW